MPVNPASICRTLVLVGLVFALAACGGDGGGPTPSPEAQVSTLAYVVTRCHEDKGGRNSSFSQTLWIRQGDREPVKIKEFALGQPALGGLCHKWGQSRAGTVIPLIGAVQRMRFTADGGQFLFELTDDFSVNAHVIPEDQQGIFAVRSDGTGLRKIAPHSQDPCMLAYWPCVFNSSAAECASCAAAQSQCFFGASPDGSRIAFADLGPSPSGEEASQVFTLDLNTGERQQVTRLPLVPVSPACVGQETDCVFPSKHPITYPYFLGNSTITYQRGRGCSTFGGGTFTVNADGTEEPKAVPVVALPGGAVVPVFQITGDPYPAVATLPGIPENGFSNVAGNVIIEVFVVEPPGTVQLPEGRVLQLTNFGRSDTYSPAMSVDWQRVLFNASDDPLGTNPSKQCQIFSIDRLGGDLRQLTFVTASGGTRRNCEDFTSPGCTMLRRGIDMITGSVLFSSTCDPVGRNPTGADQFFAIRPDGSGLVQLIETEGIVRHPDGGIDVEMAWAMVPTRVR
jgi:hypothetical protein